MIPKMSSQDLNDILTNAQKKTTEVEAGIESIKSDIQKKLMIMKYETEYVNQMFEKLASGMFIKDETMNSLITCNSSKYDLFGSTVHSSFIREAINVFNLKIAGTGEVYFRNDIIVSINGKKLEEYQDILKHESLPRSIFFNEFTSPDLVITLETPEITKKLGATRFNVIEFDSFLNGSYDIQSLKIYKIDTNGTVIDQPDTYAFPSAGKFRFVLPEKVEFYKIEITIKMKYETSKNDIKIYPFGLKHLYLYDADFRTDSYALITVNSDKSIATISENIKLKDPTGTRQTTMAKEGIEVYLNNNNGVLDTLVSTSTYNQMNIIARETTKLYVKIPLKNTALIGAAFKYTTK